MGAMAPAPRTRREFLLAAGAAALGAVAAACTSSNTPGPSQPLPTTGGPAPTGSIAALTSGATPISMLQAQSELATGTSLFTFGLATNDGTLISGGSPPVWAARDDRSPAIGPFPTTSYTMDAFKRYQDHSPVTPLTSYYGAEVQIPEPGAWIFATQVDVNGARAAGTAAMQVVATSTVAPVGSKAVSVETPVATTEAGLLEICTRQPPDPMHDVSLDKALTNGKPTVVCFATPLLCESRVCGPVVDEMYAVHDAVGEQAANFVHVEEFLPGPGHSPPPATLENQSAGFKAWGLQTEPWTFVIDSDGIVRARFEGPCVASQIQDALTPLL
jgi:hypothetical protein